MESHCIRQTELPNTSKIFSDLIYHYDRVAEFYPHAPSDLDACRSLASSIDFPDARRRDLVEALRPLNQGQPSLDDLAQPGTVAILTGQQVGLFSGPVYSLYKALTAIQLARTLSATGTPAVPVFWLATEDHDFAEVNQAWTFDAKTNLIGFQAKDPAKPNSPVGVLPVLDAPLELLRESLSGFPSGEQVYQAVARNYCPGATFGSSFLGLMKHYLGRFGLIFADPLEPKLRRIFAPKIAEAVRTTPDLLSALLERDQKLHAAGYHTQVHVEADTSLYFLLEKGQRVALKYKNNEFIAGARKFSHEDLAARAEHLSPNALLRPVMQDYLFPSVAVVGGPAELAYFAQSAVLYDRLLGHMPVSVPRAGFTILNSRARKLFDRYGLTFESTVKGEAALGAKISGHLIPGPVHEAFAARREQTTRALDGLRSQLTGFDSTLVAALDKSASKIGYQMEKLERKVSREALRRNERASAEAAELSHLLYPHNHLQERFYGMLPFLATYGEEFVDHLLDNIRLDCPDHQVLCP